MSDALPLILENRVSCNNMCSVILVNRSVPLVSISSSSTSSYRLHVPCLSPGNARRARPAPASLAIASASASNSCSPAAGRESHQLQHQQQQQNTPPPPPQTSGVLTRRRTRQHPSRASPASSPPATDHSSAPLGALIKGAQLLRSGVTLLSHSHLSDRSAAASFVCSLPSVGGPLTTCTALVQYNVQYIES